MADSREVIDPEWPPAEGAYDYIETLNNVELAWEFLRRNPAYRQAFTDARVSRVAPRALPTGQYLWQHDDCSQAAAVWNMRFFRRPGTHSLGSAGVVAAGNRCHLT